MGQGDGREVQKERDAFIPMADSQRRRWHPTPVLLPGKSHGWRSLVGCSPWGRKELDTTEPLHFDFSLSCIGEGNETHSSVLAWRIPWTEEPGGLQSIGLQRVRQLKQRNKQDIKRSICTTASPPV